MLGRGSIGFYLLLVATLTTIPLGSTYAQSDIDHDGIADSEDKCPNLQEDYLEELDGCPSNFVPWYDEDLDGIDDESDLCPNLQERYNKFQDEDGCPDTLPGTGELGLPDTDGDNIVDLVDNCPNRAENLTA